MAERQSHVDCACGQQSSSRGPVRALAAGMALGLVLPMLVGVLSARLVDESGQRDAMMHIDGMQMSEADSWLGSPGWFYGAVALVLAFGAAHALFRSGLRSCGSTPLGMGIMWGGMLAMSLGMVAGIH